MVKVECCHHRENHADGWLVDGDLWLTAASRQRGQSETAGFSPPANIFIGDDGMAVLVDLPGVDRESLRIKVEGRQLTIRGRRLAGPWQRARLRHIEWPYGDFCRTFLLPQGVDPTRISVELKDGVLLLQLPKRDVTRHRRIPIRVMEGNPV